MNPAYKDLLHSIMPVPVFDLLQLAWRDVIRIHREGFGKAYRRWRLWSSILGTNPIYTNPITPGSPAAVHLMCHRLDYLCAIWALKSFYYYSRVQFPLMLHLEGKTTRLMRRRLRRHFPNARLILQTEANRSVEHWLSKRSLCRLMSIRRKIPVLQKLTDVAILSVSRTIIMLDADVLFFRDPKKLTEAASSLDSSMIFQRDYITSYAISPEQAKTWLGINLVPEINSGITVVPRSAVDLHRCERYLQCPDMLTSINQVEQTLYALLACEQQCVDYLPRDYLVAEDSISCGGLTARHYAGPSRPLLTTQGMPYLLGSRFLQDLTAGPRAL